jgi:hypothetical protein
LRARSTRLLHGFQPLGFCQRLPWSPWACSARYGDGAGQSRQTGEASPPARSPSTRMAVGKIVSTKDGN